MVIKKENEGGNGGSSTYASARKRFRNKFTNKLGNFFLTKSGILIEFSEIIKQNNQKTAIQKAQEQEEFLLMIKDIIKNKEAVYFLLERAEEAYNTSKAEREMIGRKREELAKTLETYQLEAQVAMQNRIAVADRYYVEMQQMLKDSAKILNDRLEELTKLHIHYTDKINELTQSIKQYDKDIADLKQDIVQLDVIIHANRPAATARFRELAKASYLEDRSVGMAALPEAFKELPGYEQVPTHMIVGHQSLYLVLEKAEKLMSETEFLLEEIREKVSGEADTAAQELVLKHYELMNLSKELQVELLQINAEAAKEIQQAFMEKFDELMKDKEFSTKMEAADAAIKEKRSKQEQLNATETKKEVAQCELVLLQTELKKTNEQIAITQETLRTVHTAQEILQEEKPVAKEVLDQMHGLSKEVMQGPEVSASEEKGKIEKEQNNIKEVYESSKTHEEKENPFADEDQQEKPGCP